MENQAIEKYLIYNGDFIDTKSEINFSTDVIYEVIRVIDGTPLFLEDHMDRLYKSSKIFNINIEHLSNNITSDIKRLIAINNKPEKNIKLLVAKVKDECIDYSVFFIKSNYPEPELYDKGIDTIIFNAIRRNPNAKVQDSELREKINMALSQNNAYEALLLNEANEITEGSKSNIFFVKDDSLYTSPKQNVLLGVTRTRVIELAKRLSIEVIENPIHKSFLEECDGLFITGTSPKVLPISRVNNVEYHSPQDKTVLKIMSTYNSMIKDYIEDNK